MTSLIAEIAMWIFYAPAFVSTVFEVLSGSSGFDLLSLLPVILLIISTVFAALAIWRPNHQAAGRGFQVNEVPGTKKD